MHPSTGFSLALLKHPDAFGGAFTELHPGVDHLGLTAASREELEHWERRFDDYGVTYTPIRDMEMRYHLEDLADLVERLLHPQWRRGARRASPG